LIHPFGNFDTGNFGGKTLNASAGFQTRSRYALSNDLQCLLPDIRNEARSRVVVIRVACAVVNDPALRKQFVAMVKETMAGICSVLQKKCCGRTDSPAATRIY
jgi:hypothetical protein